MREHSGRWPMAGFTRPRYQRPERPGNRSRCKPASKKQCSSKAPRPQRQRRLSVLAVRAGRVTNFCSLIAFGGVPVSKPQNASKMETRPLVCMPISGCVNPDPSHQLEAKPTRRRPPHQPRGGASPRRPFAVRCLKPHPGLGDAGPRVCSPPASEMPGHVNAPPAPYAARRRPLLASAASVSQIPRRYAAPIARVTQL
jgi:hypothetical protein